MSSSIPSHKKPFWSYWDEYQLQALAEKRESPLLSRERNRDATLSLEADGVESTHDPTHPEDDG
jgi:hypothetical protein